jgi:hypothetical protein
MKVWKILPPPDQPSLSDETVIWRYMGFDKFIYLLANEQLYFSRLTNLFDKEEMMIPVFNELRELENGRGCLLGYNSKKEKCDAAAKNVFVNCWTEDGGESFAHWKIYGEAGVAVKSTVADLKKSVSFQEADVRHDLTVFITKVNYDSKDDKIDFHTLVGSKRKPYAFENEVRLYFKSDVDAGSICRPSVGCGVQVDLNTLINSIFISPFAGQWMIQSVRRLLSKMSCEDMGRKVDGSDIRLS